MVDIHDAVAVARDADGKLHIQDSYKPTTGEGAGWGVLLGTILGGLALAPFTAGLSAGVAAGAVAVGAASGAALGGLTGAAVADADKEVGLSEDFVDEVSNSNPARPVGHLRAGRGPRPGAHCHVLPGDGWQDHPHQPQPLRRAARQADSGRQLLEGWIAGLTGAGDRGRLRLPRPLLNGGHAPPVGLRIEGARQ